MIIKYLSRHYAPRWAIFFIDICLIALAFFITVYIKQSVTGGIVPLKNALLNGLIFCAIHGIFMVAFRIHAGIIRYTGTSDMIRLVSSILLSSFCLCALFFVARNIFHISFFLFGPVFIGSSCVVVFTFLAGFKFAVKLSYLLWFKDRTGSKRVVVLGINDDSVKVVIGLQSELNNSLKPVAFLNYKNLAHQGRLSHIPVLQYEKGKLKELFDKWDCRTLLITHEKVEFVKRNIAEECLENNIQVLVANYSGNLLDNPDAKPQISSIQIEDLLGRDTIRLDNENIASRINSRTILITGAAGSIGSEIARQVMVYGCKKLILLDIAESSLHDLALDLQKQYPDKDVVIAVGSIRDRVFIESVMKSEKIDFLYHAAAYKHVPIMEDSPAEAILTNVQGTKNVIEVALENEVSHFVMVSTDKAVNPTNIMGASKRIAEMLVQALFYEYKEKAKAEKRVYSRVVTTRFGNVLGSNGSVVPLFKKQIEQGGPITITDKEIIRYFMTISEACSLVLEAGCMGKGGELFVFDMGEPMKIYDLAEKMIRLAGKIPGKDIEIIETGLRPGEKLFEELLVKGEETISTYNSKILIARVVRLSYYEIEGRINDLILLAKDRADKMEIVKMMKKIVPEFRSNNSIYSVLDENNEG
ncbi:polysaccharide biosynthesis protein [Bacteroidales bacterium OttesenSCG-928-C19]|nr:polysaccharide biosynthesis protein [Bacteroidales bacterium OttesenSCG-928-C19]